MLRPALPLPALVLALAGCAQTGFGGNGSPPPTAVIVDPAEFLGDVSCLAAPGGMQRYVATLVDVSAPSFDAGGAEIALPSSLPTPCFEAVHFKRIATGHQYVADVQGYDRKDIKPLAPGSPVMVDASTLERVTPRWVTSCGRLQEVAPAPNDAGADAGSDALADDGGQDASDGATSDAQTDAGGPARTGSIEAARSAGDQIGKQRPGCTYLPHEGGRPDLEGPVCAALFATITLQGCAPLRETTAAPPARQTQISVDLRDARGTLECGNGPGRIASFTVRRRGTGDARSASCEDTVVFGNVAPGEGYTFDVLAYETSASGAGDAGTTRVSSTTCYRRAVAGMTLRAACDPLRSVVDGG